VPRKRDPLKGGSRTGRTWGRWHKHSLPSKKKNTSCEAKRGPGGKSGTKRTGDVVGTKEKKKELRCQGRKTRETGHERSKRPSKEKGDGAALKGWGSVPRRRKGGKGFHCGGGGPKQKKFWGGPECNLLRGKRGENLPDRERCESPPGKSTCPSRRIKLTGKKCSKICGGKISGCKGALRQRKGRETGSTARRQKHQKKQNGRRGGKKKKKSVMHLEQKGSTTNEHYGARRSGTSSRRKKKGGIPGSQ